MFMETETLRWFREVAEGESVTGVAELYRVSQPNVSRALARLERQVGTELLERDGRKVRLTQAGRLFKQYVDRGLGGLDDGLAALSELQDPETGTVALSFHLSLGTWLVPSLVAGFRQQHPRVQFRLEESHDAQGSSAVYGGRIDLEFTSRQPRNPAVHWQPIGKEPLLLAVPRDHPLAGRKKASLSEVANDDFIMLLPTWDLRWRCEALCEAAGFAPNVAFECDDVPVMRGFVGQGLGVAIIPESGANALFLADHPVLKLRDKRAFRKLGLVWSKERHLLPSAELFKQYVLTELAKK
jgi:LysR family transcriptional regulator, transcription activator of glutamate synthase operon